MTGKKSNIIALNPFIDRNGLIRRNS